MGSLAHEQRIRELVQLLPPLDIEAQRLSQRMPSEVFRMSVFLFSMRNYRTG